MFTVQQTTNYHDADDMKDRNSGPFQDAMQVNFQVRQFHPTPMYGGGGAGGGGVPGASYSFELELGCLSY